MSNDMDFILTFTETELKEALLAHASNKMGVNVESIDRRKLVVRHDNKKTTLKLGNKQSS